LRGKRRRKFKENNLSAPRWGGFVNTREKQQGKGNKLRKKKNLLYKKGKEEGKVNLIN